MKNNLIKIAFLLQLISVCHTGVAAEPDWSVDASKYELNMTITGVLTYADTLVENTPGLQVAAFTEDGACVGVAMAKYYQSVEKYRVPLMIYGNTNGQQLLLKAYLPQEDLVLDLSAYVEFQSDDKHGNFAEPLSLKEGPVEEPSGIYNTAFDASISLYPNPVQDLLTVLVRDNAGAFTVQLLNMKGQLVKQHTGRGTSLQMDMSDVASGLYVLRVQSKLYVVEKKVLVK